MSPLIGADESPRQLPTKSSCQVTVAPSCRNKSITAASNCLSKQNIEGLLEIVLERLYTLRNQLIHGGATYNSKLNRAQLRDACNIMQLLVPIIIDIMLENGEHNWGEIAYPVI